MNELDNALLDNYFNGLLSPEETEAVHARTANDAEFAQEFELRRDIEAFPRRDARRKALAGNLAAVSADFFRENEAERPEQTNMTAKVNRRRWMAVAASLLLIAAATWFIFLPGQPSYNKYAQHAPLSLTLRGTADEAATKVETDFNAKRYAGALAAIDQLLAARPDDLTAQLYKSICLIELDRPVEARAVLQPIANGTSALRTEAIWYVALSYLKENNTAACRTALLRLREGEEHYEQAQEILKKLGG